MIPAGFIELSKKRTRKAYVPSSTFFPINYPNIFVIKTKIFFKVTLKCGLTFNPIFNFFNCILAIKNCLNDRLMAEKFDSRVPRKTRVKYKNNKKM